MFAKDAWAYVLNPSALGLTGYNDLAELISAFLPVAVAVAGLSLFAYLMVGGIKYITSGGDEKGVMAAKKIITNAVVGMIIVFVSFWIVRIVETVLGLEITGR